MRHRACARRVAGLLACVLGAGLAAGCGSSSGRAADSPGTADGGHAVVRVFYAGSLASVMEHTAGPRFAAATGYAYQGQGAGSVQLANEIKGRVIQADVFISASPAVNATLTGAANGDWETWYATFASAPLVLGYNPASGFALALRTRPWYQVITEPGFRLGRTDPKLDPKGKLTVQALAQAESLYHRPGLAAAVERSAQVFPEEELVGRLESGQLDAGFFYSQEAAAEHMPLVTLGAVKLSATFTVTVLNRAPDRAGAIAFVRYLLGSQGRAILAAAGLSLLPLRVTGDAAAVPSPLRSLVPGT